MPIGFQLKTMVFTTYIIASLLLVRNASVVEYFPSFGCRGHAVATGTTRKTLQLRMGLFDAPIQPQRSGVSETSDKLIDKESKKKEYDDDFIDLESLSSIQNNGKELRGLLPPLRRRLDFGVDCYFEPNDPLVQNLIDKTSCNPKDACWALEVCDGDITEAWTRISIARRIILNQLRQEQLLQEDPDYDEDDYEIETTDAYELQKRDMKEQMKQKDRNEYFTPAKPGEQWTPIKNLNPISDEPWFTG